MKLHAHLVLLFCFFSAHQLSLACLGGTLPVETTCSRGGCCKDVGSQNSQTAAWVPQAMARSDPPALLTTKLASFWPIASVPEAGNVRTTPLNADSLTLQRPIELYLGLFISYITSIDQKPQTYKLQYKVRAMWRDCRLAFRCDDTLHVEQDNPNFPMFWRPEFRIAQRYSDEDSVRTRSHDITGYGIDYYEEDHVSIFRCSWAFEDMPFDEQTCKLTFSLPGLTKEQVELFWEDSEPITSSKLANSEWEVAQGNDWVTSKMIPTRSERFHMPAQNETVLNVEFKIKRKSSFLVKQFIVPVVLFYILSYASLWINTAAVPARVAAAIIPALQTSNKINAYSSILPPISTSTRLDDFLQFSQYLIVLHLVEYVFVMFAERRLKAMAAPSGPEKVLPYDEKKADNANAKASIQKHVWVFATKYLDSLSMVLSPFLYMLVSILILHA